MNRRYYTLKQLQDLPVIREGHMDNLLVETSTRRVWLSRMTVEDGMPYNNEVVVEECVDGHWTLVEKYEAK